ncbi:hypothetical protein [Ereboglobus luteus]|uniref:hypothetical protein n=1 Tax=Ereboglobus luteus TaxID=1796921 RepID=UPI0013751678|nr:hypothetical protein [Ereboglobus luteus]
MSATEKKRGKKLRMENTSVRDFSDARAKDNNLIPAARGSRDDPARRILRPSTVKILRVSAWVSRFHCRFSIHARSKTAS